MTSHRCTPAPPAPTGAPDRELGAIELARDVARLHPIADGSADGLNMWIADQIAAPRAVQRKLARGAAPRRMVKRHAVAIAVIAALLLVGGWLLVRAASPAHCARATCTRSRPASRSTLTAHGRRHTAQSSTSVPVVSGST